MSGVLPLFLDHLDTPIGAMRLVVDSDGNLRVAFFADADEPSFASSVGITAPTASRSHRPAIRTASPLSSQNTLPASSVPSTRSRSAPPAHPFSAKSGALCARFPVAPQPPTASSPGPSVIRTRSARSARPTVPIPSPSSFPVTASLAPTAHSPAMAAASNANAGSSTMNSRCISILLEHTTLRRLSNSHLF